MTVLVPNASEAERAALARAAGRRCSLSWAPEHVHLVHESSNGAVAERRRRRTRQNRQWPKEATEMWQDTTDLDRLALVAGSEPRDRRLWRRRRHRGQRGRSRRSRDREARGQAERRLTISNWPLLHRQEDRSGLREGDRRISVKYIEDVNDNAEFFGKLQPLLGQGAVRAAARCSSSRTGWRRRCTISATSRTSTSRRIPNVEKNLVPSLQHPTFDPNRDFSVPWQSGMTGLIVRTDLAPDVKSICDLFDPQVQGQGRHAHRAARHRAAGDEVPGGRPQQGHRVRLAGGDRQDQGGRRVGADPPLHRATTTPAT